MTFDSRLQWILLEQEGAMQPYDYIVLMIKTLNAAGYLPPSADVRQTAQSILEQPEEIKKLSLRSDDQSIPPVVIHMSFEKGLEGSVEDFKAEVVPTDSPADAKVFQNSMQETIFDDVVEFVRSLQLDAMGAEEEPSMEELPGAEGKSLMPDPEEEMPEKTA